MGVIKIALIYLIYIIQWSIIIKAILSYFPNMYGSNIYNILDALTEPIEAPMRKFTSRISSVIDLSPMCAIFFLMIVSRMIERFL